LRYAHRDRSGRVGPEMREIDLFRSFLRPGLELPEPGGERTCLLDKVLRPAGTVDRRDDLAAMADDAGVQYQPFYIGVGEFGYPVELEIGEGCAKIFALAQDRQPGQAGLETFQAD